MQFLNRNNHWKQFRVFIKFVNNFVQDPIKMKKILNLINLEFLPHVY